jgi:hypothetical protein
MLPSPLLLLQPHAQVQFGAEQASDEAGRQYSIKWAQDEAGALQVLLPPY